MPRLCLLALLACSDPKGSDSGGAPEPLSGDLILEDQHNYTYSGELAVEGVEAAGATAVVRLSSISPKIEIGTPSSDVTVVPAEATTVTVAFRIAATATSGTAVLDLEDRLAAHAKAAGSRHPAVFRRLNRDEYHNTIKDLLHLDFLAGN